jgi:hypothetical protein
MDSRTMKAPDEAGPARVASRETRPSNPGARRAGRSSNWLTTGARAEGSFASDPGPGTP